ncbi:MAG: monovalent cation/H+ antiporter subunit D family protein, partial [Gammaproteobacteria bacterium]
MGDIFADDLPALQVVVPLVTAPLCLVLARWWRIVWAMCTLSTWTSLAIAISLLQTVLADGTVSYAMGGWAAPWGIEYRIDTMNAYV